MSNVMSNLWEDLRLAGRTLAKTPGITGFIVVSLALCIGANTAIFSLLNGFFFKPLPVTAQERLIAVFTEIHNNPGQSPLSYPNYVDYRDRNDVLSGLLAYRPIGLVLGGDGPSEPFPGEIVSGNYFDVLGVRPALGRTFLREEDRTPGPHPVVVVSHGLWQTRFGGDPGLVGRTVTLDRNVFTVIGVAPEGFTGLNRMRLNHLWVPMAMHREVLTGKAGEWFDWRGGLLFNVVGRLKPGVEIGRAGAALATLASQLEQEYPEDNEALGVSVVPLAQATLRPEIRRTYVLAGLLLMTIVGLLLLIACASVANLLVARALAREREVAIRTSLGASRSRLIRQWLTEALVLSLTGAAVGLAVAFGLLRLLWALRPPYLPSSLDFGLDGRVLLFTIAVSVMTGLLFGLAPVPQLLRTDLVSALRQVDIQGRHGRRWGLRDLLVVTQVAISFVTLVGAGLFVKSLWRAQSADLGFDADHLAILRLDVSMQGYDETRGQAFLQQVVEQVSALPGVRAASFARGVMMMGGSMRLNLQIEGAEARPGGAESTLIDPVGVGYFETLGIPMLRGRELTAADRTGAPRVAVINETMAERYWPGRDPIGGRFRLADDPEPVEVVGVVRDASYFSPTGEPEPYAYVPLLQSYSSEAVLHVRTEGDPAAAIAAARRVVSSLDSAMPVLETATMNEVVGRSLWAPRLGAGLLALFALLALSLASIGLYGVIAYSVRHRRREIGIRLALGARSADVLSMVVRQGLLLTASGLAVGCLIALFATPRIANLLSGISPIDPGVFTVAALVLMAVAVTASYLPARWAAALDPITAVRDQPRA